MNKQQMKLLKQIKKSILFDYSNLDAAEKEILYFLRGDGFICSVPPKIRGGLPMYKITELGKSELYKSRSEWFRHWVPIIVSNLISVAALIVAILACVKQ